MTIGLVAAVAEKNRVIASGEKLPWHLPKELAYFHRLVQNRIVIMGYYTWCSMGGPIIDAAANWVLTQRHASPEQLAAVADAKRMGGDFSILSRWYQSGRLRIFDDELKLWSAMEGVTGCKLAIGGSWIYQWLLPRAQRLYLSLVEGQFMGDRYFPEWRTNGQWQLLRQQPMRDGKIRYRTTIWQRTGYEVFVNNPEADWPS